VAVRHRLDAGVRVRHAGDYGIFLWMCYSPSSQNAWESVYYIQNELQGGWLLRGVHHFMAQAMVVLLPIHMLQVIVEGAYKKPREINFWLGWC